MTAAKRTIAVRLAGRDVAVAIRRSQRARRVGIRVDAALGGAELVLPPHVPEEEGRAFLQERAAWLLDRLDRIPDAIPFEHDATIPYRGIPHRVSHQGEARRGVWIEDRRIMVSGREEHMARRLRDWLRREALVVISPIVRNKAAFLKTGTGRISIRDQRSRWGSCSSNGNLSFNWRLILVPDPVLDYVVAHEVGHLAVPNHSPAFWRLVENLTPHAEFGRSWLKENGDSLFRYG